MAPAVAPSSRLLLPQLCGATTQRKLLPAADGLLHHAHPPLLQQQQQQRRPDLRCRRRLLTARGEYDYNNSAHEEEEEESSPEATGGFGTAVALFNGGDFHACHDVVEELWYTAEEPTRTLLHGLLQCAVGFHHLFN
uniref:DUF309 domain-containing protein n=1 Tax=Oryza brachyantha TaxID=4533 RepID=J3N5Q7_ORYBR